MNKEILQRFLNENEIPTIKKKPKTFLEIAKQPHYENVLSNIYGFYFNIYEEHNLQDLFITSFLELIQKQIKEKEIPNKEIETFNDFDIFTEYYTKKKGRIDIFKNTNGDVLRSQANPLVKIKNDALANSLKISALFGISPVARANISAPTVSNNTQINNYFE